MNLSDHPASCDKTECTHTQIHTYTQVCQYVLKFELDFSKRHAEKDILFHHADGERDI